MRITELKSVRETEREGSQLILDALLEFLQVQSHEFLGLKLCFKPPVLLIEHLPKSFWFNAAPLSTISTFPPGLSHFCYGLTLMKILALRYDPPGSLLVFFLGERRH